MLLRVKCSVIRLRLLIQTIVRRGRVVELRLVWVWVRVLVWAIVVRRRISRRRSIGAVLVILGSEVRSSSPTSSPSGIPSASASTSPVTSPARTSSCASPKSVSGMMMVLRRTLIVRRRLLLEIRGRRRRRWRRERETLRTHGVGNRERVQDTPFSFRTILHLLLLLLNLLFSSIGAKKLKLPSDVV